MSVTEVLVDLDRLIAGSVAEDRPGLVVALAARLAHLAAGLAVPPPAGNGGPTEQAERLLTPEQAAEVAGVSKERIYRWARKQTWASRPSRRCLRINEARFRRWLAAAKA